jgi:hypothetical protein
MGVLYVRFEWESIGGCSCTRVFSPLPRPKITKIKGNIMIFDMQLRSTGDGESIHPRGPYAGVHHTIWKAGNGWLFLHEGVFPSAKAKNCENQREYHDIIDAMVELRGRQVDTSKRTPWGRSMYDFEGRAWMVVLAQGCVSLCQSKKQRKIKDNIMILDMQW